MARTPFILVMNVACSIVRLRCQHHTNSILSEAAKVTPYACRHYNPSIRLIHNKHLAAVTIIKLYLETARSSKHHL